MAERVIGVSEGVIREYKPASSIGGETDHSIAIVDLVTEEPVNWAYLPDDQNLEPGTPVTLTRIETPVGKGFSVRTKITPHEATQPNSHL